MQDFLLIIVLVQTFLNFILIFRTYDTYHESFQTLIENNTQIVFRVLDKLDYDNDDEDSDEDSDVEEEQNEDSDNDEEQNEDSDNDEEQNEVDEDEQNEEGEDENKETTVD